MLLWLGLMILRVFSNLNDSKKYISGLQFGCSWISSHRGQEAIGDRKILCWEVYIIVFCDEATLDQQGRKL